ncbi:MAG: DNA mismatch repair endonuclease MutL, partial [Phycisphaerae bacterium]
MGRIRSLPIWLVNQIAAGEVIERPASVVKELLENSIDAGANHIDVALEDGGKRLVRVSDDGVGIAADDLPLAVASHASSKIATQDDLVAIRTLGFRGEALASIAAVAAVRLVSRPHEQLAGAEIEVVAGRAEPVRAVAAPTGTTVEVRNLFFNVPARRKFLRNASTELAHVSEQLARIALPRPGVAFSLTQNGRSIRQLPPAADARERIAAIYGPELAEALLAIDRQERATRISGWIGKPAQTRLTSRWQYFFVNGRYVRDRFLAHAVREAYRGLIEPTRFAPVFLFIEIEPSAIDVNVHPTKIELRWRDSNLIHSQVLSVLREALRESNLTVALRTAEGGSDEVARQERIRQAIADFFKQQR